MKFQVRNPDPLNTIAKISRGAFLAIAALLLNLAMSSTSLAQPNGTHEYRAEGETTIETVNGLRVITLRDNVFVHQNDVDLTGDVAVLTYNANNELQNVKLTGTPANFKQMASQDEGEPLTGNSETINYYAGLESVVEFIGNAYFKQPGTTLQCTQIKHIIETGDTSGQVCSGSVSRQTN